MISFNDVDSGAAESLEAYCLAGVCQAFRCMLNCFLNIKSPVPFGTGLFFVLI
jgi:hypothetical protein